VREALTSLREVATQTASGKFKSLTLEARLAVGELEMNSSNETLGRTHLEALEKDAAREGFQLIARKAASALGSTREAAGHNAAN
jgi:hypothetical protein